MVNLIDGVAMSKHVEHLTIAFDFDGTLTDGSGGLDGPLNLRPDTDKLLRFLHNKKVSLVLWTCRDGDYLQYALRFLLANDLLRLFCAINDNAPSLSFKTSRKIAADYYVDDLAFGWSWDKHKRWLPLVGTLEQEPFFNPKGLELPGFLCREYLESLIL